MRNGKPQHGGNTGGATIANEARLQLGTDEANGSITGCVADNGTLAFNPSDDIVFDRVLPGAGSCGRWVPARWP